MPQPQRNLRTPSSAHRTITPRLTSSKRLSCFNYASDLFTQSANSHHHSGTTIMHAHPSATSSGSAVGFKLPTALLSHFHIAHATILHSQTSNNFTQQLLHSIHSNHSATDTCNHYHTITIQHHRTSAAQLALCITSTSAATQARHTASSCNGIGPTSFAHHCKRCAHHSHHFHITNDKHSHEQ
jgi:hypothetical protein